MELLDQIVGYLEGHQGLGSLIGGLLTGVGTVTAVVWSNWRQLSEARRRRRAFSLNFCYTCIHAATTVDALVKAVLKQSNEMKDAEWDADSADKRLSEFPIFELPDVLVEVGQDFRAWFGEIYSRCKDAIRDGGPIPPEEKAIIFAAFRPMNERLEVISKYGKSKYDNPKYMKDFYKNRDEFLEEFQKEIEDAEKSAGAVTASAAKRWWPF